MSTSLAEPSLFMRFLEHMSGRARFRDRVFHYLEHDRSLRLGERLERIDLRSINLNHSLLSLDIETSFVIGQPGSANSAHQGVNPRVLASQETERPSKIVADNGGTSSGEQLFLFTFTSRRDFRTNLLDLEATVQALHLNTEARQTRNEFFFDDLREFLESDTIEDRSSLEVTIPSFDGATEPLTSLRLELNDLIHSREQFFRMLSNVSNVLEIATVILPTVAATLALSNGLRFAFNQVIIVALTVGTALLASIRFAFQVPRRLEAARTSIVACYRLRYRLDVLAAEREYQPSKFDAELSAITADLAILRRRVFD